MKSYLDLVGEYGKTHAGKNRITIWCIAIAVCLVTAIFGMADMEIRSQIQSQIKTNGNYHVMFKSIDEATADLIGNRVDVAVSGWVQTIGEKNDYKIQGKPLAIMGSEEAITEEMGLKVTEGKYPQKPNEALLDRQALEQFSISLGDKAPITFPDGSQHDFSIVGTYSDFASLKKTDTHGLVLSYASVDQSGLNMKNSRCSYYVQFKKGSNMRQAIYEIKTDYQLSKNQIAENTALLGMVGQSRDSYMIKLYMTAAVLFVLVLIAGILMIASSFNMAFLERVQFFGLLRCLGASQAQVKKFVLVEGLRYSLRGIPIGLLVGTTIVWAASAFLKYVNPAFFSEMPLLGISGISLIAGVVVGLLTVILASLSPCRKAAQVSPLSAVTGNINNTNRPQSAVNINHTRIEYALGIHHAFAGKKNILLMTGSFAISIILFLSFSVMVNFMYQAIRPLKPYTPDISVISKDNTCFLSEELFEQIQVNPDIKHAYGRMFAYDVPITSPHGQGRINLISYEGNQFAWAKKQLTEGNIDEVTDGTDSVLVVYSEDLKWKLGDTVNLRFPSGEKEVKIAGILSSCPFARKPGVQNVICSEELFRTVTGENGYTIIDIQLAKSANKNTVAQIRNLTTAQMIFSDQRQGNEEARTAFYSFAIFVYGFLVVIALITVFNIINSMNTSVASRMNQYGIMRAVGMSGQQLRSMVMAEAATYACLGCLAGCILGLPLHHYLFSAAITFKWGLAWQPPFAALAIIVVITVLTAVLSIISPVNKIRDMDIMHVVNAQ